VTDGHPENELVSAPHEVKYIYLDCLEAAAATAAAAEEEEEEDKKK